MYTGNTYMCTTPKPTRPTHHSLERVQECRCCRHRRRHHIPALSHHDHSPLQQQRGNQRQHGRHRSVPHNTLKQHKRVLTNPDSRSTNTPLTCTTHLNGCRSAAAAATAADTMSLLCPTTITRRSSSSAAMSVSMAGTGTCQSRRAREVPALRRPLPQSGGIWRSTYSSVLQDSMHKAKWSLAVVLYVSAVNEEQCF